MKYPKRSQYKHAKSRYRVRNWRKYEAGLRRRGDVTVWLCDDALDSWRAPPSGKPGHGGRTQLNESPEEPGRFRLLYPRRIGIVESEMLRLSPDEYQPCRRAIAARGCDSEALQQFLIGSSVERNRCAGESI